MRIRTHSVREPDKIDCRILGILQEDARISVTDLAEQVGLSVTLPLEDTGKK